MAFAISCVQPCFDVYQDISCYYCTDEENYVLVSFLYLLFPFPSGHDDNLSSIASAKEIELLYKKEASQ